VGPPSHSIRQVHGIEWVCLVKTSVSQKLSRLIHLTRNEKVVGSIPTGGSTFDQVRLFSEAGDTRG